MKCAIRIKIRLVEEKRANEIALVCECVELLDNTHRIEPIFDTTSITLRIKPEIFARVEAESGWVLYHPHRHREEFIPEYPVTVEVDLEEGKQSRLPREGMLLTSLGA